MHLFLAETKCKDCQERDIQGEIVKNDEIYNKIEDCSLKEEHTLNASQSNGKEENKLMCPMCSKVFPKESQLSDLEIHVEQHFLESDGVNNYVVI